MEFFTTPIVAAFFFGLVIGMFVGFGIIFLYKLLKDFIKELVSMPVIKHLQRENKILKDRLNDCNLPMNRF